MSDARLREAERRWREGGRREDEAAWLRERARAGGLDPLDLAIAAACGHPAAVLAVSAPPSGPRGTRARVEALFAAGGGRGVVHLACALLEDLLERVDPADIPREGRELPFERGTGEWLLERGRAWLACPCATHAFRMPTHFWLHEHELAMELAEVLHHGTQQAAQERADPHGLVEKAAALVARCARLERRRGGEVLDAALAALASRLLDPDAGRAGGGA